MGAWTACGWRVSRSSWIKLDELVAAGYDSPLYNEEKRAGTFYSESWALVQDVLTMDDGYRPKVQQFLAELGERGTAAAFERAYGKSIAQVEKDLQGYIRTDRLNAAVVDLRWEKNLGPIQVQRGASLPARLALAELEAETAEKSDSGFAEFAKVAAEFPKSMEAQRDWAASLFRMGRMAESLPHFASAMELGSRTRSR